MNRSSLEHGNRQAWTLGALAVALLLLLTAVVGVGAKEIADTRHASAQRNAITSALRREVQCVATWANTLSARVDQQTRANAERLAALDTLVRALRHGTPASRHAAVVRYLRASNAYNRQIAAHPLPPAPQFLCDKDGSTVLPDPPVVTVTPAPSTTTRVVPKPTTITRPGHTRTVTKPGPTVTRPGRTVTRTVHPPAPSSSCPPLLTALC